MFHKVFASTGYGVYTEKVSKLALISVKCILTKCRNTACIQNESYVINLCKRTRELKSMFLIVSVHHHVLPCSGENFEKSTFAQKQVMKKFMFRKLVYFMVVNRRDGDSIKAYVRVTQLHSLFVYVTYSSPLSLLKAILTN